MPQRIRPSIPLRSSVSRTIAIDQISKRSRLRLRKETRRVPIPCLDNSIVRHERRIVLKRVEMVFGVLHPFLVGLVAAEPVVDHADARPVRM
jgi:hypothetical protein